MVATIQVKPGVDITELLDAADEEQVVLERNGKRYRLAPGESGNVDIWAGYEPDPDKVRAMLEATAGSWSDLDVDRLIEEIYEAREQGSRPWNRP